MAAQKNLSTNSFSGSIPRRSPHITPFGHAVKAVDCKLWHGTLQAWREPLPIRQVPEGTKTSYQAYNCCWLHSSTCASFAEGSTEQRHVFATGYNGLEYPVRIVLDNECNQTIYRLGLPCPTVEFTLTANEKKSRGAGPRQYIIQYEDSFGNRSAGSNPSELITVEDGDAVLVSGWAPPLAAGWDIQHIVILRSAPGFDNPFAEEKNSADAAWMEVDKIPVQQTSYLDKKHPADLQFAIIEDDVKPPPAGLKGMTWVQSMNCLVGFIGRRLVFSKNNNYNDWSAELLLDDTIRAIAESNDVIYVATDGAPYVAEGSADCKSAGCRRVTRMPEALPIVSPFTGMTALPSGAVYASHNGIVAMSGNSVPKLLSEQHYAPDDWQALHPDTAKLMYFEGSLFCFCRKGAFLMNLKDGAGYGGDTDHHTELSLRPDELLVTRNGSFLLRFNNTLSEWNRGARLMPYHYESGTNFMGVPYQMGAAQVMMTPGDLRFRVYADDFLALDEAPLRSEAYTMPMWSYAQRYRYILDGTATVQVISIAPSMKDL